MSETETFDYIVVGAGAGGAVVAARLAEGGRSVLVLEAGDDPEEPAAPLPDAARPLEADHSVPAFHTFASEHPAISWDFWVRHYADDGRQRRDWKYRQSHDGAPVDGVLYPRSSALGGCTAHHALIIVQPNNADWNHIAETMRDTSWKASNMRRYFRRIERCRYRLFLYRWLDRLFGFNPTGHGWDGWLATERTLPLRALRDWPLKQSIKRSIVAASEGLTRLTDRWRWVLKGHLDPNDRRMLDDQTIGIRMPPMSSFWHARTGPCRRLKQAAAGCAGRLTIRTNAFVTRVEIDPTTKRATGVVYCEGARLYRAAAAPHGTPGEEQRAVAGREVILAGGAFNTPQLLMLSGIGDPGQLAEHGIEPVHALAGVGGNLQDRYEVSVVNRMRRPWQVLKGADYSTKDRHYRRWRRWRRGNYTSNGVLFSVVAPSRSNRLVPDLHCFGLLADFRGYYPGYSERIRKHDFLTWTVLKAYTENTAGTVRLRSADPFSPPEIQFRYFEEGNDATGADLEAVVAGVRYVRGIADAMGGKVDMEESPGRHLYSDDDLKDFVRDTAWGHHACGTCAMKPQAEGGVVDSDFRVYGIAGLRIVDASVFPRIPGYFIAAAIYMIAEKAADVILAEG